jgi:glycosyltransferase involved in cell wall biosynthesis
MKNDVQLSVIIPVLQRTDELKGLYAGYDEALQDFGLSYEVIFVVDGGGDAVAELEALKNAGHSFSIISLAKHFGESTTLLAGFDHAKGQLILTLPAYHQIEPASLAVLLQQIDHCDMAIGRRWPRAGGRFETFRRRAFHSLLKWLSGEQYHDLGCGVRLFKRQLIDEIHLYGDQHRFFPVLASRQGFKVAEVDVKQSAQDNFRGRYRLREYLHRLLDIVTVFFLVRFTKKPLRFFGMIGSIVSALGALVVFTLVVQRLFFGVGLADRPALLLGSLLLVLGVQVFALGLIGELIIFTHAGHLKEYTVESIVNDDQV